MFSAEIKISCKNPKKIVGSMKPDLKNDKNSVTKISAGKNFLKISVKSRKLGHLQGIINSYISIAQMLIEADEKIGERSE